MPDCIFHPAAAVIYAHLKKRKEKKGLKENERKRA